MIKKPIIMDIPKFGDVMLNIFILILMIYVAGYIIFLASIIGYHMLNYFFILMFIIFGSPIFMMTLLIVFSYLGDIGWIIDKTKVKREMAEKL